MSPELKVKRLDSPLSRNTAAQRHAEPALTAEPPAKPRRRPATAAAPRLTSVATKPRPESTPVANPSLPEPPPLEEALELISSRLPSSLRRSLTDLTTALRARSGERLSQKSLPEQEILAVLIWAAGSAEDPDAIAHLSASLNEFRARRYATAAEALRS